MSFIGAFLGLKRLHSRPSLYGEAEHLTLQHSRQNDGDPVVRCIDVLEHRFKEVVGIQSVSPQACPLMARASLTSRECTAEGVMIEAAVEKSNSARMRSWNLLYSSTILFYTSAPISSEVMQHTWAGGTNTRTVSPSCKYLIRSSIQLSNSPFAESLKVSCTCLIFSGVAKG